MKKWIKKVKEGLEDGKEVGIEFFVKNLRIIIEPYGDKFNFTKEHGTEGFGHTTIERSLEDVLYSLRYKNKPDMLFIGEEEVDV